MRVALSLLVLGSGLLHAAPDAEAAKKALRIAWASQYEWKEDKVRNITFDFVWRYRWKGRKPEDLVERDARGSVVIVDGKIERIHLEGGDASRVAEIRGEMDWVLARFAREPFEKAFEEVEFEKIDERSDGRQAVVTKGLVYVLKDDRIVGYERDIGRADVPYRVRVDCATKEMGGGYAILEQKSDYQWQGQQISNLRVMNTKLLKLVPVPNSYVHESKMRGSDTRIELSFTNPRANAEHPVVLDPAARDLVAKAWEAAYRLPAGTRVDGQWKREPDNATAKGGWMRKAYGEFQFLNGELEVLIDDKLRLNEGTRNSLITSCTGHIREIFGLVLDRSFEDEFKGCGFVPDEKQPGVVRLVGHPRMTAVRVEGGALTGHEENSLGGLGWWEYRHTKAKDGRLLINRMTRRVAGKKWHAKIAYSKKKGTHVPKSAEVLVPARVWNRDPNEVGLLKYTFRRLEVIVPK